MSARDFLNLLEERDLLDATIIADLRRQIDEAAKSVSAETIAKLLVENEHLTRFQATKLVGEATVEIEARRTKRAEERADADEAEESLDEDDLLLGGLADSVKPPLSKTPPPPPEEIIEVVEEVSVVEAIEQLDAVETIQSLDFIGAVDSVAAAASDSVTSGYNKKSVRVNPWDSPLMLVGCGALAILSLAAYVLWMSLTQANKIETFNKAMESYGEQAYQNAIERFEKFLKNNDNHEFSSEARVRIRLSSLRIITDSMRSPEKALEVAQEILPEIKDEEAFPKVREELASILPDIAEGFVMEAKAADTTGEAEKILKELAKAMKLVNNPEYIPKSLLRTRQAQLELIAETKELVERGINQERTLVAKVEEIRRLVEEGKTREAYKVRDDLLLEFPQLENDPRLVEQVASIGEAELAAVEIVALDPMVGEQDVPPAAGKRVVLAGTRPGMTLRGAPSETVFLAGGALYGVDTIEGSLLWRRFVGFRTTFHPVPLQSAPGSDIIAVESNSNAILRMKPKTGEVVWRQVIGEEFNDPQVWRNRAVLSTKSGKVISVNVEDGSRADYAELGQKLSVSPGVVPQRSVMYQVGENDNLYLLNQETLACTEVYYLKQKPGTVTVPPLAAFNHLFVFENAGTDKTTGRPFCNIHVLKTDGKGGDLKPAQQPVRVVGHVVTRPIAERQRLTVATDLGAIHIFSVDGLKDPPLSEDITGQTASDSGRIVGYLDVNRADMWVARSGLAKVQILAAKAQMAPIWSGYPGDIFTSPVQVHGKTVYHLRRPFGSPGFTVGSNDVDDPNQTYWSTDVAVPAALTVIESATGQPMVFSRKGGFFRVNDAVIQAGYLAPVFADDQANITYTAGLPFGDNVALFSPAGRALVYDPTRSDSEMRSFRLNIPKDSAFEPIAYQDAMLVPLANGQIQLLDIDTGGPKAAPFQPSLRAGESVKWFRPTVVADGRQFVIADSKKRVFRVSLQAGGRPRLVQEAEATLKDQMDTQLAELKNFVFAGARYDDADVLMSLDAVTLEARDVYQLSGRVIWGPVASDGRILLATTGDGIACFDENQELLWNAELTHGRPTGEPAVVDGEYLIATVEGAVMRLEGASGSVKGVAEVGEPLSGSPLPYDGKVGVVGADGTFHIVEFP